MPGIEDLIRTSLRQRAEDVEPTPALWLEVDRRIARRQRWLVTSWALAGVAAVLAAVAVVPGLVGSGDADLQILDRVPATGVVPDTLVADVDGRLELHDLETGDYLPFHGAYELAHSEHAASSLAVRPGSTRDDFAIVAVRGGDGQQPAYIEVARGGLDAEAGPIAGTRVGATTLTETFEDPAFVPSVVWAPDTDAIALTLPADADGARVVRMVTPDPTQAEAEVTAGADPVLAEMGLVIDRDAQLLAWVGATEVGDTSWLWIRRPDGDVITQELVREANRFRQGPTEPAGLVGGEQILDVATSFASGGAPGEPLYALTIGSDLPTLQLAGGGVTSAVRLGSVFGEVDPATLWLDAKQDAALVGDGAATWAIVHDGDGTFASPMQLPDGYHRAALFDTPRPDADRPDPDPPTVPAPDDPADVAPEPGPEVDEVEVDVPGVGAELPEPVVVGSGRELRLIDVPGERTLLTMGDEGESWIMGVAVRPGSRVDDLTAVVLTTAEGMWDLRELRIVDGEVDEARYLEAFPPAYRPATDTSAEEVLFVSGPVWSPDGDSLAWVEQGTAAPRLRVIGWSDGGPGSGDPASDNAVFEIDDLEAGTWELSDWVDAPEDGAGATRLRLGYADFMQGWMSIRLVRQADGAWSQPSGPTAVLQPRPPLVGSVAAMAGVVPGTAGDPAWVVLDGVDGPQLVADPYGGDRAIDLPADLLPGDGIPSYWVRAIGDGAIVGSPNTDLAYYVAADGSLNRLPGGAAWVDVLR